MSKDLIQKAAKMVIDGATILSEPCPYCKGVRVMKDGSALCINCGKRPAQKSNKKQTKKKKLELGNFLKKNLPLLKHKN